ncbi:MAG: GGDEF domain-containing protein [Noviherbaspirillum sp.]
MPSTFFVMLSGAVLCFILLLVLLSLRRTGIAGVQEWCVANALAIVAFTLYGFGRVLPPFLAYEVANACYVAAVGAVLVGYRRFFDQPAPLALTQASVVAALLAVALFHYVIDSFLLRTLIVSLYYVIACIAIGSSIFRARAAWTSRYAYMFSGVMAFVVAVGHGARGILQAAAPAAPASLLEPSAWNLVALSASTFVMPVLTLGPLMMVHSKMIAKYEYAANRDFLTGAWSRRAFWELAAREIDRVRRTGRSLSLLAIDIDHFKRINDTYGHAEGDAVLKQMVMTVEGRMRSIDYFGRIGGEEFAILMPDTGLEGAHIVAERLRVGLAPGDGTAQPTGSAPAARPYTVSIGVAQLCDADSFHDLMQRADAALYQAKERGRNRVVCAPGLG